MKRKLVLVAIVLCTLFLVSPALNMTSSQHSIPSNVVLETELPKAPSKMAVYRVTQPRASLMSIGGVAEKLGVGGTPVETEDAFIFESRGTSISLVAFKSSDSFIYGDFSKWGQESYRPALPRAENAVGIARTFLEKNGLLPKNAEFTRTGGMSTQVFDGKSRRVISSYQNDVEVVFSMKIDGYWIEGMEIEIALGDKGEIIGIDRSWREFTLDRTAPIVDPLEAVGRLAIMLDGAKEIVVSKVYIAYYSLPSTEPQEFIEPFYIFEGTESGVKVSLPFIKLIPALAEVEVKPLATDSHSGTRPSRTTARAGLDETSGSARREVWGDWVCDYDPTMGPGYDLAYSDDNVINAYNYLVSAGWLGKGCVGDANAWEDDFVTVELGGIDYASSDDVDLALFSGHGSYLGWYFGTKHDDWLAKYTEIYAGDKDLEWLVVAACQVLQESSPAGSVLSRWGRIFKGLHYLMSYDTVSYDTKWELKSFAKCLTGYYGSTYTYVRNAWLFASRASQPSSVHGAYLRAGGGYSGAWNTYNDRPHYYTWQQDVLDPIYKPGVCGQLYYVHWTC